MSASSTPTDSPRAAMARLAPVVFASADFLASFAVPDAAGVFHLLPPLFGGEESGGLSVKGHVPEKDGILACLLMAELVAVERKPLKAILAALEKKTGEFHTTRINVAIPAEKKAALLARLAAGLDRVGTLKVEKFITTDGFKFLLPNREWVAFRASGTEPLIRCYIEARTAAGMKKLEKACKAILLA